MMNRILPLVLGVGIGAGVFAALTSRGDDPKGSERTERGKAAPEAQEANERLTAENAQLRNKIEELDKAAGAGSMEAGRQSGAGVAR